MSLVGASFATPSAVSRTCVGRWYSRSRRHVWHTLRVLAQVWQTTVVLKRMPAPGFQRKTVNGRAHVPHSRPNSCLDCSVSRKRRDEKVSIRRYSEKKRCAHHPDERVVPQAFGRFWVRNAPRLARWEKLRRTCLAKDGKFALLPTGLVNVCFGWHSEGERWGY